MTYIGDYLHDIKSIAAKKLALYKDMGDNPGVTDGTNLRMTPAMLDRLYSNLKIALNESDIYNLDEFDLQYFSEYVL